MSGRLLRLSLAFALAVSFVLSAQPMMASNFGSNLTHPCDETRLSECIANNGYHVICFDAVEANQVTATRWSMANNYDPVASVQTAEVSCTNPTASIDVKVRDGDYDTSYWGWTQCAPGATYGGTDPNRWCKPQLFVWELNTVGAWDTTFRRRYIACHELGHTLGLRHSDNSSSCLYQAATSNALTSHDINHLNSAYGTMALQEPAP